MILEITDENFESLVLNNPQPIVLDFWAPGCGPCKTLDPHFEKLSTAYKNQVRIGKVNIHSNAELSVKFGIRSIPTVLYFKNGQIVDKHIGATTKNTLENKLIHNLLNTNN